MIKTNSISFKIIIITMITLVFSFMIALMVTTFQIEQISSKFYSAELDNNSGYAIGMIDKLIFFGDDNSELEKMLADYEKIYPYKIEVTNSKSLSNLALLNKEIFNKILNSNGEGKVTINAKIYYVKIYEFNPILYSDIVDKDVVYFLILAKEVPLFSDQSMQIISLSGIILVLIGLPMIFLLLIFLKRFTNPIVKMSHLASEIANGNLSEQVEIDSNDEIGDLARSINHMTMILKENEKSREAFLASVSHELRTPLTALKANTKGMLEGIIHQNETKKYLYSNMEEIERLILMVNDLILVSTFEENTSLNLEETDISRLLSNVVEQLRPIANNKHITIRTDIGSSLIRKIDNLKLKQVFINIIDNAIKFSQQQSTVTINARLSEERIIITVTDGACALSQEELNHLFDRFYKSDRSTGLGLGLYISKLIIDAHHGNIRAYNDSNNEATFEIII